MTKFTTNGLARVLALLVCGLLASTIWTPNDVLALILVALGIVNLFTGFLVARAVSAWRRDRIDGGLLVGGVVLFGFSVGLSLLHHAHADLANVA